MSAIISDCGFYRYRLERVIDMLSPVVATFIMLNPSTADAEKDDATIRKLKGFCKINGWGKLVVVNLFAFRATQPKDMKTAKDPIGQDNNNHILAAATEALVHDGPVICAWGANGKFKQRDKAVTSLLAECGIEAKALRISEKTGQPEHPLYIPYECKPIALAAKGYLRGGE